LKDAIGNKDTSKKTERKEYESKNTKNKAQNPKSAIKNKK
jgi:hypothetical protein